MAEGTEVLSRELEANRKKIEELEGEKKGLAEIIEQLSDKDNEPKAKRPEDSLAAKEEMKKQLSALMKEKVDPKLAEISEKLKGLDRINDMGDKLSELHEKLSSPLYQPKQPGTVSQGLASFGEQIDFQSELNDVRKSIDGISQSLSNMSKKIEYRLASAEDRLKELDKVKELEEECREINSKIGAENIQKLKKIIFSAEELTEEVIPEAVSKQMRKAVEPLANGLKANKDMIAELERKIVDANDEIKELRKFRDTIQELRMEKDKLYKKFGEEEARFLEGLEILKMNIRRKMEKMMEKYEGQFQRMQDFASPKTIEASVNDVFAGLFEQRLQEIEKHGMILDERSKALADKDRQLAEMIDQMEAPESVRRWVAEKAREIERKLNFDVQSIKKEEARNAIHVTSLRERQKSADSAINEISRKITEQSTTMNRVIDLRDVFAKRAEGFGNAIKSLEGKIATEREKAIMLEQAIKEAETGIDKISENVSSLQKAFFEIKGLKEKLSEAEASLRIAQKKLSDKEALAAQVKKMEAEIASLKERHDRMESQAASDRASFYAALQQAVIERKNTEEGVKKERMKVGELLRELKQ